MVEKNISLNGAEEKMKAVCADVFDLLKQYEASGEKFDVIILDPPAFTKKAGKIEKAYGGYKEINLRAMRILNEGGILVSCSCSHYFDENTFYSMLMHSAMDSHKRVQVLEKLGAAPDHPILLGYSIQIKQTHHLENEVGRNMVNHRAILQSGDGEFAVIVHFL